MCFTLIGVIGSWSCCGLCCFVGVCGIDLLGSGVTDLDDLCLCGSGLIDRDRVGS